MKPPAHASIAPDAPPAYPPVSLCANPAPPAAPAARPARNPSALDPSSQSINPSLQPTLEFEGEALPRLPLRPWGRRSRPHPPHRGEAASAHAELAPGVLHSAGLGLRPTTARSPRAL